MGLATLDLSTGEFWISEAPIEESLHILVDELVRIDPKEVIFPNSIHEKLSAILKPLAIARLVSRDMNSFEMELSKTSLTTTFDVGRYSRASTIWIDGWVPSQRRDYCSISPKLSRH